MGAVVGHEMTHGFDDQGRKYDADGCLRDWWAPGDGEEYERRAQVTNTTTAHRPTDGGALCDPPSLTHIPSRSDPCLLR